MAEAWTSENYTKVLSFFYDSMYYSDALNYCFKDKVSLLEFFANDDGEPQECVFHNTAFDESKQIGAAEYTYHGTHLYHGTVWIEIENNKIISWREYQHISVKSRKDFWQDYN